MRKIAYVIGTYPSLTKTFIDREVLEARRLGLPLELIAIRRPATDEFSPEVRALIAETRYLLPAPLGALCRAHARFALRRPRAYFGTLRYLLTRRHPTLRARAKTVLHFGKGVLAAAWRDEAGIAHVHAHFADRAAVVAIVVSELLGKPYIVTAHAADIYRSPVFLRDKLARATFATTCTAFNKSHLERSTGRPVELVYHGLDFASLDAPHERSASRERPPLLLAVGQLRAKKGFSYLLRACARLREQGVAFRCEIVGDGPERERLAELVAQLEIEDCVTLAGALPNARVLERYPDATLFVLPSVVAPDGDRDGIPNVILEAMAFGVPVVATDVSGIPEAVRDGETGRLVRSASAEALAEAIGGLLADPAEAARLGRNAADVVRREFDIRRNVGRLIELLTVPEAQRCG